MSYYAKPTPTKPPVFIARRRYGSALGDAWSGITSLLTVGGPAAGQVITSWHGGATTPGYGAGGPAPESGFPWVPVVAVGVAAVVGVALIKRSRRA